ncbi:MAG: hypothetical protein IIA67_11780 [Planctomycetes bacterium]|nr:hypothetical protein [Planctomycetota bacterium]
MPRDPLAYYLIDTSTEAAGGQQPVATVTADDGGEAILLFDDGEVAADFCDLWSGGEGWQVAYMNDRPFLKWLREQAPSCRYVLLNPIYDGPDDIIGEMFDTPGFADELASREQSRGSKSSGGKKKSGGR